MINEAYESVFEGQGVKENMKDLDKNEVTIIDKEEKNNIEFSQNQGEDSKRTPIEDVADNSKEVALNLIEFVNSQNVTNDVKESTLELKDTAIDKGSVLVEPRKYMSQKSQRQVALNWEEEEAVVEVVAKPPVLSAGSKCSSSDPPSIASQLGNVDPNNILE